MFQQKRREVSVATPFETSQKVWDLAKSKKAYKALEIMTAVALFSSESFGFHQKWFIYLK